MAAEDNKNRPKLVASIDTTDDPRIFINQDNINPHQHHRQQLQQPSNYFGPAGTSNIADSNAAFVSFNSGGLPPQVGIPIPPPLVVAADDQVTDNDEEYFSSFPPGYRFCPLDRELILDYLYRKVHDLPLPRNQIREVNLYRYTPDTITELYPSTSENQWYFFTQRDKKYLNGSRPNRAAGTGFWKATGADKAIYGSQTTNAIGFRKALVYYEGKPPRGNKTNWIMHEYKLHLDPKKSSIKNKRPANDMRIEGFVLCKLYKKINKSLKSTSSNDDDASEERGQEVANGENDTQAFNFAPSKALPLPYDLHSFPIPINPIPIPIRIPVNPIPIQSYHSQSGLSSFRQYQPVTRYHQPQQHHCLPVSNSQFFISQSYPPSQQCLPQSYPLRPDSQGSQSYPLRSDSRPDSQGSQSYPLRSDSQGLTLRSHGLSELECDRQSNSQGLRGLSQSNPLRSVDLQGLREIVLERSRRSDSQGFECDEYIREDWFDDQFNNATPDSYIDSSSSQPSAEKQRLRIDTKPKNRFHSSD